MFNPPISAATSSENIFSRISGSLRDQGYFIIDQVFSVEQLQSLYMDIKNTHNEHFHQAGIGREQEHQLNQFVRGDRIRWLDMNDQASRFYLQWSEQLRQHLNRELYLGLFDYECHYAHFPEKAFYKKHLDAFKGSLNRRLSTVLYLNPAWQPSDGGELILYSQDDSKILETVMPMFGKMVIFMSEEFPHEVLPTQCSRYSLTGWFRVNNTLMGNIDPPA